MSPFASLHPSLRRLGSTLLAAVAVASLSSCADTSTDAEDAAAPAVLPDAGVSYDGSFSLPDTGVSLPAFDAGLSQFDGGVKLPDGGGSGTDSGVTASDGGVTASDGGSLDGGTKPADSGTGIPDIFGEGGIFNPPPATDSGAPRVDAGGTGPGSEACKNQICIDVFDCYLFHPDKGSCGFSACDLGVCK